MTARSSTVLMFGETALSVEVVTPAVAARWLTANACNRRLREPIVRQYERDMLAGKWVMKPVPICFDPDAKLGNGQHTLNAIVSSGVAQECLVARQVSREAIAFMDMGLRRSINDVAHFLGEDINSRKAAIARMVVYGPSDHRAKWRSFHELLDAYIANAAAIEWVLAQCPKQAGFSAPVLGVVVRAAYNADQARLQRFLHVLLSGVTTDQTESAAIRLRDCSRSMRSAGTAEARIDLFRKAQAALACFLRGEPMRRLYATEREIFPAPPDGASFTVAIDAERAS